jgi:hypothetical protein
MTELTHGPWTEASLAPIRAACELVASASDGLQAASVTFRLDERSALERLRRVAELADEYGLEQRVDVQGFAATVSFSRPS